MPDQTDDSTAYRHPMHWPGYVSRAEHNLRVSVWNIAAGVTVAITGVVATPDGCTRPFLFTVTPTVDRLITTKIFPFEDGIVLFAQAAVSAGTPIATNTYVRVELIQGREGGVQSLGTMIQGYVTPNSPRTYPNDAITPSIAGPGFLRRVQNAAPAAGADWIITVPANARWRPISLFATLTTAVAAANRLPVIVTDDGVTAYGNYSSNQVQAASLVWGYTVAPSNGFGLMSATSVLVPIADWIVLGAGHRLLSSTTLIQAADQWSAQQLLVEEWLDV